MYLIFGLILSVLSGINYASQKVITLSVGPSWYAVHGSQTQWIAPNFDERYVSDPTVRDLVTGGLFLGIQYPSAKTWMSQTGLSVVTTRPAVLQGDVWELSDPMFNNFSYRYNVSHTHVALKEKLVSTAMRDTYGVLPYISGSLGIGFNHAYQFHVTPNLYAAISSPSFQSNTQTTLAYTFGFGLDKVIHKHWQIGIGYALMDWGKSSLSPLPHQPFQTALTQHHLYTNELHCNISYLT